MHKNYLQQKQPSCLAALSPSAFPETVFSRFTSHFSLKRKVAFTLAETLITLGIIGVVAAITMPALISNVQGTVKQKRVENIKQKLSKVTDKMAVQSGLSGYGTTEVFVNEMTKHMKVAKVCDNAHLADCWPTEKVDLNRNGKTWNISETKNSQTIKISKIERDNWDNTIGIVTADGVPMILSYKKDCDFDIDKSGLVFNESSAMSNSMGCLSGVFDWNGGKKPNKLGDDVLTFGKAKGLGTECVLEFGNRCITAPFTPTALTKAECEAQKRKLGIKWCPINNDLWAGAVAECGGVQYMPTMDDLDKLASLVYNGNPTFTKGERKENLSLDASVATTLGITGTYLNVWSGEESFYSNNNAAGYRVYRRTSSYTSYAMRDGGFQFAATCVEDL